MACETTAFRMVDIFFVATPASGLLIPILFAIADLISEVYGFYIIKCLIRDALKCQVLFGIMVTAVVWVLPGKATPLNLAYQITFRIYFGQIL